MLSNDKWEAEAHHRQSGREHGERWGIHLIAAVEALIAPTQSGKDASGNVYYNCPGVVRATGFTQPFLEGSIEAALEKYHL